MDDLCVVDCDIMMIGQYLQLFEKYLFVEKYYLLEEFVVLKQEGLKCGFSYVEFGLMVCSFYYVYEQVKFVVKYVEQVVIYV